MEVVAKKINFNDFHAFNEFFINQYLHIDTT